MENYIVRIYRRENNKPAKLVGLVERPDSGENWKFGTIDELCNILVNQGTIVESNNLKQTVEQRRYRRFLIKEGALIFDSESMLGLVGDISMGGLSFLCLDGPEHSSTSIGGGAFRGEEGFCTETLPCRHLPDHGAPSESSFARTERRRCRVEFGELDPGQKMQLLHIIQNFTV
jgi:hypothetical protein